MDADGYDDESLGPDLEAMVDDLLNVHERPQDIQMGHEPDEIDEPPNIDEFDELVRGLLSTDGDHDNQGPSGGQQPLSVRVQRPLTHLFGDPSVLAFLGNRCQQNMFQRFVKFHQGGRKPVALPPLTTDPSLTGIVLRSFVQDKSLKTVASVAETNRQSPTQVTRGLLRSACLLLQGTCWIQGSGLAAWKSLFEQKTFVPILLVSKMRYDETPLCLKINELNKFLAFDEFPGSSPYDASDSDSYRFAKVLRVEWELGWLVKDNFGNRRLFTTVVPTPLNALERNTAECISDVLRSMMKRIPDLQSFASYFPLEVRLSIVDRFGANMRAEKFIKSLTGCTGFQVTCDVHKIASSTKRATKVFDNTFSGLVNLALSLQSAGSLDSLRRIAQEIIDENLLVAYDHPPMGDIFKHRQAVVEQFIPIHQHGVSQRYQSKARKRRFVINSLANSDISSSEITHFCTFGCCQSFEHTKHAFKKHLVWALIPAKQPLLNRKSWTGADHATYWAALLHMHWQLLPRIMLKFLSIDRPISAPAQPDTASLPNPASTSAVSGGVLGDVDGVDMNEFNALFQNLES